MKTLPADAENLKKSRESQVESMRTPTPELREITLGHKHDGGTGITNFSKDQAGIYRESIRLHGDPALVVSERDFMEGHPIYFSLHDLNPERFPFGDLSPFWQVHDLVSSLYETRKLFGVAHTGAADWVRYRDEATQLRTAHAAAMAKIKALVEAGKAVLPFIGGVEGRGVAPFVIEDTPKNRALALLVSALATA